MLVHALCKDDETVILSSPQGHKQPNHPGYFAHVWVRLEAPKVRDRRRSPGGRGALLLASQGEFFIGAGNVALVTVALSEVGTSVVLSNRAWPGAERKRVRNAPSSCTEGPWGAVLMGPAHSSLGLIHFEDTAFCCLPLVDKTAYLSPSTKLGSCKGLYSKHPAISQHQISELLYLWSPKVTSFSP